MPAKNWNLEFRDHNSQRNYPLADFATRKDQSQSFELPMDFIVGLDLPIHSAMGMEPGGFFIRMIGVFPTGYSMIVAYDGLDGIVDVATAAIPRAGHTEFKSYALGGIEPFDDTVGKVLIGRLESIDLQPSGVWLFNPEDTPIEPDCIRPNLRGIQSIVLVNGTEESDPISEDIEFEPGTNLQIVPYYSEGRSVLRFNAISGEGTVQECVCEGDAAQTPCIKSINDILPTVDGRFNLLGDSCLEWQAVANGLQLTDKCCQPCCSCEELEAITRDLERFNTERATFKSFVAELQVSVTQMSMTVLGARLGDRSCFQCD